MGRVSGPDDPERQHAWSLLEGPTRQQADDVVRLVGDTLGDALLGVSLHGSAVLGGLRGTSDLDLLAVTGTPTTDRQRRALTQGLLDVSRRRARGRPGRPVELTVVVQEHVRPWHFPPMVEYEYGEWLRDDYERGTVPGPRMNPDLALLVTVALAHPHPLLGASPVELLDPVPHADVRRAAVAGIPGLLDDFADDTRNVLLTLARIWVTLATGTIRPKDRAADWALRRLPELHRPALQTARDHYLVGADRDWPAATGPARACADHLAAEARRLATG